MTTGTRTASAPPRAVIDLRDGARDRGRATGARRPRLTYRRDIDGLRAIAVGLVVAFHAGVAWVPGGYVGVDVFFVISGFLITGLLVDELERTGTVSLADFYARRIRRLLPLSTLVLVAAAIITAVVLPPLTHASIADDIRSAALWVSNWHFAAGATQYMTDSQQSPVLHYWSLSLEEQFYVLWPLLILLVVRTLPRWGAMGRRRLATVLAIVLGGSLLLSLVMTSWAGPWAYFGLQTRAWELAAGAALALAAHRFSELTLPAASLFGWAGLGLILFAAFTYTRATPYPGIAATVPVLGACLVLVSGARTRGVGPAAPLSHRVTVYVGQLSYGWYLWHWPLLVAAAALAPTVADADSTDTASAPWTYVLAAVVLSFGLAALSHRLIENPVRRSATLRASRPTTFVIGAVLTVTSLLAAGLAAGDDGSTRATTMADPSTSSVTGPLTAGTTAATPSASAQPVAAAHPMTPSQARDDAWPQTSCFTGFGPTEAPAGCRFGSPNGSRVVALVGDSHAAQWLPALDAAAKARGWQVYFWAKSSCPMTDVGVWLPSFRAPYDSCSTWRTNVVQQLQALPRLDLVVVGRSRAYTKGLVLDGSGQIAAPDAVAGLWADGTSRLLRELSGHAAHVVLLRDTPWADQDVPNCLSAHMSDVSACSFARAARAHLDDALVSAEKKAAGSAARILDPTTLVCPKATCDVVAPNGAIVYRDGHHLTRTFSAGLATPFGQLLAAALAS